MSRPIDATREVASGGNANNIPWMDLIWEGALTTLMDGSLAEPLPQHRGVAMGRETRVTRVSSEVYQW